MSASTLTFLSARVGYGMWYLNIDTLDARDGGGGGGGGGVGVGVGGGGGGKLLSQE